MPDVERRRPLDDPLGHEPAHAAGPRESVRAEAGSDPEAAHVGRPEDELAVGRECLGTVDKPHDAHLRERGDADDRVLHQLLEARPVLLEQLAVEVRRDPVERPGRAVPLVAAHDQAARLRPEVDEERRVAHGRHVERQPARLEHEVLVRHRHDRHDDARERPDLARVHPARVDDDLGLDRPAVRLDRLDPPADGADPRDACRRASPPPRAAARPRRARTSAGSGRCSRRSGGRRRRATPSSDIGGKSSCASAGETSSSGRPNVFAQPA